MDTRILIIEDDEYLADALQRLLGKAGYTVDVAGDFGGGMDLLTGDTYSTIFLDINLQGAQTGIDLLKEIRRINIETPVVIMTGYPAVSTAAEAVRSAAFDYLCKPVENEQFLEVARAAVRQNALNIEKERHCQNLEAIVSRVREAVGAVDDVSANTRHEAAPVCRCTGAIDENQPGSDWKNCLSEREQQVLNLLSHGESSADIAARFSISIRTVGTYYSRIIEKLELNGMKELKQFAIRNK